MINLIKKIINYIIPEPVSIELNELEAYEFILCGKCQTPCYTETAINNCQKLKDLRNRYKNNKLTIEEIKEDNKFWKKEK